MNSYDDIAGSEQDADSHPSNSHEYTRMAGDVVPLSPNNAGTWQNAGPAAATARANAAKIRSAPSTGNVIGIGTGKVIK